MGITKQSAINSGNTAVSRRFHCLIEILSEWLLLVDRQKEGLFYLLEVPFRRRWQKLHVVCSFPYKVQFTSINATTIWKVSFVNTVNEIGFLLDNAISLYTRFFQNLSHFKVNGVIQSMHLCMVPFERELHLEVFGQVWVSPFEF